MVFLEEGSRIGGFWRCGNQAASSSAAAAASDTDFVAVEEEEEEVVDMVMLRRTERNGRSSRRRSDVSAILFRDVTTLHIISSYNFTFYICGMYVM